ncbi:MAG: ATP-binding cassette domain-containing protein [Proteobacteria bacterium]|nr:ATP-binding cassette domain-containing protein [Pseudomonadota bacterium]NDC25532.1 ATP-binding cassette domain-containing protein [Pseudomonadota bacterium]NDG26715.1 ATP-binding cassette domain-containing protein [Pseudomonadota bacterium]
MLEVKNLSKVLGERQVLENMSLSVQQGEILFVLGRSGVGKSVLLKTIVGLIHQDKGEVWIDGEKTHPERELAMVAVRRQCGLVFQSPALFDSMTVKENLIFGDEDKARHISATMAWLKLPEKILNFYPSELSFGFQKKVSLLRTLLSNPKYLLFDEPTTGLDPVTTNLVNDVIRDCAKARNMGCLVVSHDLQSAYHLADRIVLIDQGKIALSGTPSNFKESDYPLAVAFRKGTINFAEGY